MIDGSKYVRSDDLGTQIDILIKSVLDESVRKHGERFTYELCPNCEHEVKLKAELKEQICPDCNNAILPCSMCETCNMPCHIEKRVDPAMTCKDGICSIDWGEES